MIFRSARRLFDRRFLCIAAGAIAIGAAAPAAGGARDQVINTGGQAIVVPAGTALQHWSALSQAGMSGAKFTGRVSLTGTFYYLGSSPNAEDPGTILFEPDSASAARLPYMKEDGKPPRSLALKLDVPGNMAALPMPLRRAADASRGQKAVMGPASLSITGYLLFKDGCGASEYQFEGETIDHAGPMRLSAPPQGDNHEGEDC